MLAIQLRLYLAVSLEVELWLMIPDIQPLLYFLLHLLVYSDTGNVENVAPFRGVIL